MSGTRRLRRISALSSLALIFTIGPLAGRSASGQVGTGSIIGQVTDESGAVLPGVTVIASSPALQLQHLSGVTDERGEYRLTPLPIGTYTVEYQLQGFQTIRREGVRLPLDFTARLDVALKVGALEETVTVSGAAPVVDVQSTATRTQIAREALETIPRGSDGYIGLMQQAPGTRSNIDVGGSTANSAPVFRAFGMSGQSWQSLDGVVTAGPNAGTQSTYVDYESFEEATIQTLGHDASVPTRGIAINAVVKSGSNDYHGSAYYGGTNNNFQSSNVDDALARQGVTSGDKIVLRDDVNAELGGRLVRDKLWFWIGPRIRRDKVDVLGCFQEDGATPCYTFEKGTFLTHKETYQVNSANRLIGFTQFHWRNNTRNASSTTAWEARRHQTSLDGTWKVEYQRVQSQSLFVNFLVGSWWNHSGTYDAFAGGRPPASDSVLATTWGTNVEYGDRNFQDRYNVVGGLSWYKPDWALGNHAFKAGFEHFALHANRQREATDAANYQLFFRSGIADRIGAYNAPVEPDSVATYTGTYVQDAWTIARRLTLNLGIRVAVDRGSVPEQCRAAAKTPGDVANPAQCFAEVNYPDWYSFSPRLRAAYDIAGNGKSVVKGGWGRYYRMRYSSDVFLVNKNTINQVIYRWRDLNGNKDYDPGEVNLDPNGTDYISRTISNVTGSLVNGIVNPDEKQAYTDEYMLQFEHELMPNFAVRATGVHARALRQTRVENSLRPYSAFNIPIRNPDPGPDGTVGTADDTGNFITYFDYPSTFAGERFQAPWLVNDPTADEKYSSFEIAASRRLVNRWQIMASFSATKLNVPYSTVVGSAIAFQAAIKDPNSEIFSADTSWEWIGRTQGSYQFPAGVLVAANFEHRSGATWARTAQFRGGVQVPNVTVRVEPSDANRRPNLNVLDLRAEKRFSMGAGRTLKVRVNMYNALNTNTVTGTTIQSGPNFGRVSSIFLPRLVDFGIQYNF